MPFPSFGFEIHPISAFDAGWQPESLSLIARLPAELYYSILFIQKMCAFRRLVLECFHKQKTTKITLHFPKIIEIHLNSSSQCIQLGMRQVNKREKNTIMAKRKIQICSRSLWDRTHDPQHSLWVLFAHATTPYTEYMLNLLYIYRLFLASAIYDCVNTYTIVHVQGYSSSGAVSTL